MTQLEIENLNVRLGGAEILSSISANILQGQFVGLIGPNGAGKSTLLRAIMGLIAYRGDIRFNGASLPSMTPLNRARAIAYLPQTREVNWPMAAADIVALGREPHRPGPAPFTADDRAAVLDAMQQMDVAKFSARIAQTLSGGELARVLIARALAQDCPLLLADEPTAGLDPAHQIGLMQHFTTIARQGRTVIACLHELSLAARWCDRLILLDSGRIAADGVPESVITERHLADVYGITARIETNSDGLLVTPLGLAKTTPNA